MTTTPIDYDTLPPTPIVRTPEPTPVPFVAEPVAVRHPEPNAFIASGPLSFEERIAAKARTRHYPTVVLTASECEVQYRRLEVTQLIAMGLAPDAITVAVDQAISASERSGKGADINLNNLNMLLIKQLGLETFARTTDDLDRAMCIGGGVKVRFSPDESWVDVTPSIVDALMHGYPEDVSELSERIQGAARDAVKSAGAVPDAPDAVGTARAGDGVRPATEHVPRAESV